MSKFRFIILFLCSIFILSASFLSAGEKKGADVVVKIINGSEVKGELIAVMSDSHLVLKTSNGSDSSVYVNEIDNIRVVLHPHPWRGAGIGFLSGIVAGFFIGSIFPGTAEATDGFYYQLVYSAYFVLPAAYLGLITSAIVATDKTYQIKGWPSNIVKARLEKLRKKARVKDFN